MNRTFSKADYFLIAKALRHERASRVYNARKRGHAAKGLNQLHRLERIFQSLGDRAES